MKKNLLLLCVLSGLICTMNLGANVNSFTSGDNTFLENVKQNRSNDLHFNGNCSTKDGIRFNVNGLGKPFDLVKCDLSEPNSDLVRCGSYVFDEDWLISKYKEAAQNNITEIGKIEHTFSESKLLKENTENYNNFGFANAISKGFSESHLYVKNWIRYDAFRFDLPELTSNTKLYSEHLSDGFSDAIKDILNGESNWEEIFDIFGTHVLSSVCYGGYTGIKIEKSSRKASIKVDSEYYSNITRIVAGGPDQYSSPLIFKGDIASKIIQWLKHVREEVIITKFNEAIPIWEFLPNNIQNRDELVKNAIKAFYEHKKKVESTLHNSTLIMRGKNEVDVGSRRDAFRGSYWSPVAHNILFRNQEQKDSYLKNHGSQIVNLAVSNNAKDGWKNSFSKYLNIETFSASGTSLKPFVTEINPNHNHPIGSDAYNFTYNCMSIKYNLKLDVSSDIELECFANTLSFLDSLVEHFF